MNLDISYNDEVRRRFAKVQFAGGLTGSFDRECTAVAAESDQGAQVRISAGIRDGKIAGAAYEVWGCPHLIAAADVLCERMQGQPLGYLENHDLAHISKELCIPAEKAGRILLLEDALAMLWAQCSSAS